MSFPPPVHSAEAQAAAAKRLGQLPWQLVPSVGDRPASYQLPPVLQREARIIHNDMMTLGLGRDLLASEVPMPATRIFNRQPQFVLGITGAAPMRRFVEAVLPHAPAQTQRSYGDYAAMHKMTVPAPVAPAPRSFGRRPGKVVILSPFVPRPPRWWHRDCPVGVRAVATLDFSVQPA